MRLTVVVLTAAFAGLFAAAAPAEERKLVGAIKGDPDSKVQIVIKRVGGAPFRVQEFKLKQVDFTCFGSTPDGELTDSVKGRMEINKTTNPFDPAKRTNVYFSGRSQTTKEEKAAVFITGIVDQKAKRTSGNIGLSFGDGCGVGGSDGFSEFVARR